MNKHFKFEIYGCEVVSNYSDTYIGIRITPKGYWTDVINVRKSTDLIASIEKSKETGEERCEWVWEKAEITNSSGGSDGTLEEAERVKSFIKGLEIAMKLAAMIDEQFPTSK